MAAQIKLLEAWKAVHVEGYAIVLDPYSKFNPLNTHELRTCTNRVFNDTARLKIASHSFNIDTAKLWNMAPGPVTNATTIAMAKTAIKNLVQTFPV